MHRVRTLVLALVVGAASPRPGRPGHGLRRRPRRRRGVHAHQLGVRQCGGGLRARPRRFAHGARDGRDRRNGTGAGLGSQGALILDGNRPRGQRRQQLALAAARRPPRQGGRRSTRARRPISVTVHGRFVYVLTTLGRFDAGEHPRVPRAVGQARPAARVDAAERRGAGPGAGRVQPQRPPPGRDREGDEPDRHLRGAARLRERPERTALGRPDPFGFGFDRRGLLIVSEAFGGAPTRAPSRPTPCRVTGRSRPSRRA